MKTSKLFSIDFKDVLKGLLIAVLTPVFTTIYTSFELGIFTLNWHLIGVSAIGGAMAYLGKNFFSPAKEVYNLTDIGLPKPPKK